MKLTLTPKDLPRCQGYVDNSNYMYFKNMEGVLTVESAALQYSVLDPNCVGIAVIGGSDIVFHPRQKST